MPIPDVNTLLIPFLEILRDGQPHTREIVVLTTQSQCKSIWQDDQILGNCILTWDMNSDMNMSVRVCSIYQFKGLESAVIILTELDKLREGIAHQLIYVGLSRARSHAIIIGQLLPPEALKLN